LARRDNCVSAGNILLIAGAALYYYAPYSLDAATISCRSLDMPVCGIVRTGLIPTEVKRIGADSKAER
jgi:hypothetical protein